MESPQARQANVSVDPLAQGLGPIKWMLGLFGFMLRSGSELTRLVGEMHHAISQTPPPFARDVELDSNKAHKSYLLLRMMMEYGADRLHQFADSIPSVGHPPVPVRRFRSAINGVMGDKLQEWGHPLRQSMELVNEDGRALSLSDLQQQHPRGVVLFVHGLCLSEWDWQSHAHSAFVRDLQQQGHGVGWLRYNSGLPIWENGAEMVRWLDDRWRDANAQSLTLIGHSMGGLVIRSALHHAEQGPKSPWLSAVSHVALLATPHAGAPLEKLGNMANSLLGVSPYSKPLMALGNIRSQGIRSLRHGNITAPANAGDMQHPVPLQDELNYLLLGARLGDDPARHWIGDGLVPVHSAMGEGHFPDAHPRIEKILLDDVGHLRLLQDARTYDALRRWLALDTLH